MSDCIFCKIINKEIPTTILYEDDLLVSFRDIRPKAEVHLLVVPKQHINNLTQLDHTHSQMISHLIMSLPKIAKAQRLINGFRTIINTGIISGQEIDHLHVHILGGKNLPGF